LTDFGIMAAAPPNRNAGAQLTQIGSTAAENLRYIRSTIEATQTFTSIPGTGCIAIGSVGLAAAALETLPGLAEYWLAIWTTAAVIALSIGLVTMLRKARSQGLSLSRTVARRFFLTLTPPFLIGAILTAALVDSVSRDVIAGIWLLSYGAGIAACGAFSVPAVVMAGFVFMALGTLAVLAPAPSAVALLALGFGLVHIALGLLISRHHGG
jgi:hypothetical protein